MSTATDTPSAGDFTLQMPENLRSQLEVISGEYDNKQRRGGIIRLTVDVPSAHSAGETRTPRWRTLEFGLYYVVFIAVFPWMIYVPIQLSYSAYSPPCVPSSCSRQTGFRDTSELQLVSSQAGQGLVSWQRNCESCLLRHEISQTVLLDCDSSAVHRASFPYFVSPDRIATPLPLSESLCLS
jgi:hypothetical protein